jgi:hypothetical protein
MRNPKKSDLAVGISLGLAAGLLFMIAVVFGAIYFFPRYFDMWDRHAPPAANALPQPKQ